jgi:cytochrome c5
MKKFIIISAVFVILGCVAARQQSVPSQSDVDRVASKFPGYSLDELNKGKSLFEKYCGLCHGLKAPASQTEAEWNKIVPQMSGKVNKKENNVLDAKAQEAILRYVITMGSSK